MVKTIGLSFWGYLGDNVADSPSGANFYLPSAIKELNKRGYKIYSLQEDRDGKLNEPIKYENFMIKDRIDSYNLLNFVEGNDFPELDILYIEWRWPIEGRNTINDIDKPSFTPDLIRQQEILDHYMNTNTKIVIWDQDYKITEVDEEKLMQNSNVKIVETSVIPRKILMERHRINVPFDFDVMSDIGLNPVLSKNIIYIGNNYEREDIIDKYMYPISEKFPGIVKFYGNWRKYPAEFERVSNKWPNIDYKDRITKADFEAVYRDSLCVPLLAKNDYLKNGFMTARLLESLYFGSLPIGFREFNGIDFYLLDELIVDSPEDFIKKYEELANLSFYNKIVLRDRQVERLRDFMDVKYFVNILERI